MRIKHVIRYYCDFCSKGYFRIDGISKHESRCTANPNRNCGMCATNRDYFKMAESFMHELSTAYTPIHALTWIKAKWRCPICVFTILRLTDTAAKFEDFRLKEEMEEYNKFREYPEWP